MKLIGSIICAGLALMCWLTALYLITVVFGVTFGALLLIALAFGMSDLFTGVGALLIKKVIEEKE